MDVRLVVQSGARKGQEIVLPKGKITIGRRKGCQVRIADARVSREHCTITFDGSTAVLDDLGSANGTQVNGQRVEQAALKNGDQVLIGGTVFAVVGRATEVPDEAVAVLPTPAGGAAPSDQESIADVMASMAQAETAEPTGPLEIELDFSGAGGEAGAAPAAGEAPAEPVQLVEEDVNKTDDDILSIQWEPPEEEKQGSS